MRIAHMSDTHLGWNSLRKRADNGRNQRGEDARQAFADAVDSIIQHKPDLLIHSGDLFDRPRPSWSDIALAIDMFRALDHAGVACFLIAGNHDTATLRTQDNVFDVIQAAVPMMYVVSGDEQRYFNRGEYEINLIASRKLRAEYPPTALINNPFGFNIMVVHGIASDIPGSRPFTTPGEEQVFNSLLSKDYDYIAMGDWHEARQVRPNAWYAGATERFDWGECDYQPGWLLVELERDAPLRVTHMPIATRPMLNLPTIDVAGRADKDVLHDMQDAIRAANPGAEAMVRQTVTGIPSRAFSGYLQRQMNEFVKTYPVFSYSMPFKATDVTGNAVAAWGGELPKLDIPDLFRSFVASRPYTESPFGDRFLKDGLDALAMAAQVAQDRDGDDQ